MITTPAELKARFATNDVPSGKDFSDLIDTMYAANRMAQQALEEVDALVVSMSGVPLLAQVNAPTLGQSNYLWLKLDSAGIPLRIYKLYGTGVGADNRWHAVHPIKPGVTVITTDAGFNLADIGTYDGGGLPGTGAMWEINTELQGRFPLGVSSDGSTYPIGTLGGEAAHVLSLTELPAHSHGFAPILSSDASPPSMVRLTAGNSSTTIGSGTFNTNTAGTGDAHNNLPPYRTAYYLRRTTRTDYVEAPGS